MAGDTTSDLFVPSAHSWTDYISTPGWHRYLFFIGKSYVWLCQERRKEPWRNHTGKAKNTLTSATKTVSIFRAIKEQIRRTSIVCSAIVLYMHWEINVVVISALRKAESKTAPNASFLTEEKISDMLQVNIASLRKLYGSSGKNKKQASSDTGKCIFLCLNWPVLLGVDNICYLSEKIQKIILWFGEKPWVWESGCWGSAVPETWPDEQTQQHR